MKAEQVAIARQCLDAAHYDAMPFPEIVATLAAGGFEGYTVDFRRGAATYFASGGDHVDLPIADAGGEVAPGFDGAAIRRQIAWAQANASDYAYREFCRNVRAAGCAGYIVSFPGRRVLYFGRTAEVHVELFPA